MSDPQLIDVHHLGRAHVIGCWRIGDTLIDPGPESSLGTLLEALDGAEPRRLLLTHIHLDHSGAAGSLVQRYPDLEVWVSERGAPHLKDPSKLLASAARLYGDQMDRLWGEVVPVPERNLHPLIGGEHINGFRVAATPGHASHHVSFLAEDHGWAFTGDVTGVRIGHDGPLLPPTPPPDIDLEAWRASLETIGCWAPSVLALTHFGRHNDVERHLDRLAVGLRRWGELARQAGDDAYRTALAAAVISAADRPTADLYEQAMPPDQQWAGLDRYWRKRSDQRPPAGSGSLS